MGKGEYEKPQLTLLLQRIYFIFIFKRGIEGVVVV